MAEKEYIERDEAINQFTTNSGVFVYGVKGVAAIISRLRATPSADVVEVRRGYWDDNIIGFCNVCMECGAIVERTAIKSHTGALNYCPNCGADMRGEKK